jgi:hypothetical protein
MLQTKATNAPLRSSGTRSHRRSVSLQKCVSYMYVHAMKNRRRRRRRKATVVHYSQATNIYRSNSNIVFDLRPVTFTSHLKPPLNFLPLHLPPLLPRLLGQLPQILHISSTSLIPLRIHILDTKIRTTIRLLRSQPILHRPSQAQKLPRVLAKVRNLKVFVAWDAEQFHVVQGGTGVDGIDPTGDVVFVPAAAGVFPDGVFDPFLGKER